MKTLNYILFFDKKKTYISLFHKIIQIINYDLIRAKNLMI